MAVRNLNTLFSSRRRFVVALLLAALLPGCACCTDLALAKHRDDAFLNQYQYALGEQYLTVGDYRVCYQEFGQGEPLLIIPGLGTSIDFWQLNIPTLARSHRVLALDPVGFGKSDKPDVDYDLCWIVDRIVEFMDAKGLQRTSIMGGSLGGHLALLIALKHPERVDKIILMGSVGNYENLPPVLDFGFRYLWPEDLVINGLRSWWPGIYKKFYLRSTPLTEELFRFQMALRSRLQWYYPEGRAASRSMRSLFFRTCRYRLPEIESPVLLLWGQKDVIHPAAKIGRDFRRYLPDSRLVVLPDAAHEAMIDQPQVFNALVLAFLRCGTSGIADFPPQERQ